MAIIHGIDSNQKVTPLLLDANGRTIISAEQLTTTGGKFHVDANGDIVLDMDSITTTGGKINIDSSGNVQVNVVYPHSVYSLAGLTVINKDNSAYNGTTIVHTVTAGKTLYITSLVLACTNVSGASQTFIVRVRNVSDVKVVDWTMNTPNVVSFAFSIPLPIAYPVPAGYDIVCISPTVNATVWVTILGYEI